MNKTEMIDVVASKTGMSKKDSKAAVEAVFAAITEELASGNKVAVAGFGTFEVKDRAARTGINPATKQPIEIAASKAAAFKAASALKDAIAK